MKKRKISYFKFLSLFFTMIILVFIAGCTGTPPAVPIINSFSANPSIIIVGESSTLSWSVTDATSVTIDQSVGSVASTGTTAVTPATTTTYTLTATNVAGSVTATTTVTVNPVAEAPIINSFLANPPTITEGESSTLSWSVTDATSVTIDNAIGSVALTGTTAVNPTTTTTYTLTATNAAGSVTATTTVTVNPAVPVLLINYPMDPGDTGGDLLHRGFYINAFPGTSISKVDLWIGANTAGDYTFELTARESTYDGTIIETSQANISLTGNTANKQLTTFNFSSNTVQMNSIVTFTISKVSGPGACYYSVHGEYGGIPEEDILVIQTTGTTPPLDSHRSYGIAIRVYGHE
jgi:hypothetical protein